VVAAAQAGKHVLCEKPMCNTVAEARRMIDACQRARVALMIGFSERYAAPFQDAKRRIEAGEIGEPMMLLARRCHPKSIVRGRTWLNDRETGGVLNYAGTHNIDLICWLANKPVRRVYAELGQLVLKGQDFTDCAVMTFQFEDGAVATLYESFAYPDPYPHGVDRSLEILGTRGVIRVDMMRQPLESVGEAGSMIGDAVTWPREGDGLGGALRTEAEHFVRCVLTGAAPLSTGADGLRAIALAQAAVEAARTGQAVSVTV
jgi:predicted dehydrogenase